MENNQENVQNEVNNVEQNVGENKPQKSGKGKTIALMIIVLVLVLAVGIGGGYLLSNKNSENSNNGNENKTEQSEENKNENNTSKKIDESKDWVYDAEYLKENKKIYQDSAKTEEYACNSDKDLVVPYININSEYAKQLNASIESMYNYYYSKYGTEAEYSSDEYKAYYRYSLKYNKYINDNILSIVITLGEGGAVVDGGTGGVKITIYTYNINLGTLSEANLNDMANKCGFSSEYEVISKIKDWDEKQRTILAKNNYQSLFIGVQNGKYFIDENGKLNFVYSTNASSIVDRVQPIENGKEIELFYTEEENNKTEVETREMNANEKYAIYSKNMQNRIKDLGKGLPKELEGNIVYNMKDVHSIEEFPVSGTHINEKLEAYVALKETGDQIKILDNAIDCGICSSGNGGTLYVIWAIDINGNLYTQVYNTNDTANRMKFNLSKEQDLENILFVVQCAGVSAQFPLAIDIDGNTYSL